MHGILNNSTQYTGQFRSKIKTVSLALIFNAPLISPSDATVIIVLAST